jgi:phosphoketolase
VIGDLDTVYLMRLQPASEHPHGLPDAEFDALFTRAATRTRDPGEHGEDMPEIANSRWGA